LLYPTQTKGEFPEDSLGRNWLEFCDKLNEDGPTLKSFNHSPNNEGLGVCVSTGWGDGYYPVYVRIKNGRVSSVTVDFGV
jgi:hypothetical protein